MSAQTFQAIWECDPVCTMFRLISEAKPELLEMLVASRAVPIGPVTWTQRKDRLIAIVPVHVVDDWPEPAHITQDLPAKEEMALAAVA